jgi:hypothetical protein
MARTNPEATMKRAWHNGGNERRTPSCPQSSSGDAGGAVGQAATRLLGSGLKTAGMTYEGRYRTLQGRGLGFLTGAVVMGAMLLVAAPVEAALTEPDAVFYGTASAADGTAITASVGSDVVGQCEVQDGAYVLYVHMMQPTVEGEACPPGFAFEGDAAVIVVAGTGVPYVEVLAGGSFSELNVSALGPPTPTPTSAPTLTNTPTSRPTPTYTPPTYTPPTYTPPTYTPPTYTPAPSGCCQLGIILRYSCMNVQSASACSKLGGTFQSGYKCGVSGACVPPNTPTRTATPTKTASHTATATPTTTPSPTPSATATPFEQYPAGSAASHRPRLQLRRQRNPERRVRVRESGADRIPLL